MRIRGFSDDALYKSTFYITLHYNALEFWGHTDTHLSNGLFFQDNRSKPAPKG